MSKTALYFSPQPTRSARARWAFLEAGIEFEPNLVDVFKGEQKASAYLSVNPLGIVPTATFDGAPVTESSALALIAAFENDGAGLLPKLGSQSWREALQWAVFAPAELDHLMVTLNQQRLFLPPSERSPQIFEQTVQTFNTRAKLLSERLSAAPYLLGENFSVADICVGHSMVWARFHDLLKPHAALTAYLERLAERPAFVEIYGPKIETFPDPHAKSVT